MNVQATETEIGQYRQQYDLITILDSVLGESIKRGKNYSYHCPFHQDNSPSFSAFQSKDGSYKCMCFAGCTGVCPLDVVDFIQQYYNYANLSQAMEHLSGGSFSTVTRKYEKPVIEMDKHILIAQYKERCQSLNKFYFERSLPYIEGRGISEGHARLRGLALDARYEHTQYHKTKKGKWISFTAPRYLIPRQLGYDIVSVNTRRDDVACRALYHTVQDGLDFARLCEDMGHECSEDEFVEYFHKYKKFKMYGNELDGIWNINRLFDFDEQRKPTPKKMSFVCIAEAEYTAAVLERHGIPCIQTHRYDRLAAALRHVDYVYILADNDKPHLNKFGRWVISGDLIAEAVYDAARHPNVMILKTPNHKSIDEQLLLDPFAGLAWMREYGIMPIDQERIDQSLLTYNIY